VVLIVDKIHTDNNTVTGLLLTCRAVLSPGHGPSASWTSLLITVALKVENGELTLQAVLVINLFACIFNVHGRSVFSHFDIK